MKSQKIDISKLILDNSSLSEIKKLIEEDIKNTTSFSISDFSYLIYAIQKDKSDVLKCFIDTIDKLSVNTNDGTDASIENYLFSIVITYNALKSAKVLIEHGFDVNEYLHIQSDPDSPLGEYIHPLHKTAQHGSLEMMKFLISKGADPRWGLSASPFAVTSEKENLFHSVAQREVFKDTIKMIKYVSSLGVDINAQTELGVTPLMYCPYRKLIHYDRFIALLDAGADPSIKTNIGDTILSIMVEKNNGTEYKFIKAVLEHNSNYLPITASEKQNILEKIKTNCFFSKEQEKELTEILKKNFVLGLINNTTEEIGFSI